MVRRPDGAAEGRGSMKRVFRAATLLQVAHARNVLVSSGIACELRNQYLAGALGELPMIETWPQLFVDEADEQPALRALARAAAAPAGEAWVCSGCDELLEPQFTACWRCGAEVNAPYSAP
jgi:Putative prokaryotic signal transducing protein